VKVKLAQRWGQYPPSTELDMHEELAKTLVAARIARKVEEEVSVEPEIESAAAPPVAEAAARTARPGRRRKPEATP